MRTLHCRLQVRIGSPFLIKKFHSHTHLHYQLIKLCKQRRTIIWSNCQGGPCETVISKRMLNSCMFFQVTSFATSRETITYSIENIHKFHVSRQQLYCWLTQFLFLQNYYLSCDFGFFWSIRFHSIFGIVRFKRKVNKNSIRYRLVWFGYILYNLYKIWFNSFDNLLVRLSILE